MNVGMSIWKFLLVLLFLSVAPSHAFLSHRARPEVPVATDTLSNARLYHKRDTALHNVRAMQALLVHGDLKRLRKT